MTVYLVRRILQVIPVLWLVTVISFAIVLLVPGDAALALLPEDGLRDEELYQYYRRELGLDRPLPVQYLNWVGKVLQGNLGVSFRNKQPVLEGIAQRLGPTIELSLLSLLVSMAVGLPVGVFSAIRPNSKLDAAGTAFVLAGVATPNFWLGIMLILVASVWLRWLPAGGYVPFFDRPFANLKLMILPAITLGTALAAITMRQTRSALLEVLHQEYITTARAKGLKTLVVMVRHGLKNALIPVVTIIGLQIGRLVGGTVIVESVFGIPGIGRLAMDSIFGRDIPMVQGVMLLMAIAVLISNLFTDILYAYLDPRIRYG
jgi:peptide/nickel transport system permease protein